MPKTDENKSRPPRVYQDSNGRRYIKAKNKKIYLNSNMTNKQLVKVIINNFKKVTRRRKKIREPNDTKKPNNETSNDLNKIAYFLQLNKHDKSDKEERERNKMIEIQNAINQHRNEIIYLRNQLNQRGPRIVEMEDDYNQVPIFGVKEENQQVENIVKNPQTILMEL